MVAFETEFRICADYDRGNCTRDRCSYVHNSNKESAKDAQICADFDRGKCTRPICRFVHNENRNAVITRVSYRKAPSSPPPSARPVTAHVAVSHLPPVVSVPVAPPASAYAAYELPHGSRDHLDRKPVQVTSYVPEAVSTRTAALSSNPYLPSSSSAPRVENNPYLLAAKLSASAAAATSYAPPPHPHPHPHHQAHPQVHHQPHPQVQYMAPPPEMPPPMLHPPPMHTQMHTQPPPTLRLPNMCSRRNCSYIHNINEHARKDGPACREFTATGTCVNLRCPEAHNVNPNPPRDNAPHCADFMGVLRSFYQDHPELNRPQEFPPMMPPAAMPAPMPPVSVMQYHNAAPVREEYHHQRRDSGRRERESRDDDDKPFTWCIDWERGICKRPTCTYVHNVNPRANRHTADVCGDFQTGNCKRETCKYIHNSNANARVVVKNHKRARLD